MNHHMSFSLLLTFMLLMATSSTLSYTPLFEKTTKYIETGSVTLDTTSTYSNISADVLESITFTGMFTGNISTYNAVSSIQTLNYEIPISGVLNVTCFICGYYSTALDYCLITKSLSRISTIKTRYMIIDSSFTKITHFYSSGVYYVDNFGSNPYDAANPIINNFGIPAINTVGTTRLFIFVNGFNATSNSNTSYSFDIHMNAQYIGSSVLRVTTTSSNAVTIMFNGFSFAVIGYNEGDTMSWPFPAARISLGTFDLSSPWVDSNSTFETYNTFWGLKSFNTSGLTTVNWDSSLTPQTSVTVSTTQPGSSYTFVGLAFEFKQCNSSAPYYMASTDLCYDICPNRYYQNNGQMICSNCTNYDCLKCLSNGTCTTCDNVTDHRVLNTSTGRCDPDTGYYESGVAIALPCDSNCLTCSGPATTCTSCRLAQYLSGTTCNPCSANCSVCTNGSACATCDSGYTTDGSGNCVLQGYNCSTISNCQSCNFSSGCLACDIGYNLTNVTQCSPVCGDGIWLEGVEECDDNNTIAGDGCSSACFIESSHYCTGGNMSISTCSACSSFCANCTSATNCTLCQASYTNLTNATGQFCQADCSSIPLCTSCYIANSSTICDNCSLGYGVGTNNSCQIVCGDGFVLGSEQCDDGNNINGDGCDTNCTIEDNFACVVVFNTSVCTQCVGATFQATNKTVCEPCANYDCGTCNSSGTCTSCNLTTSHRAMDVNTSRCVPVDGFYDDGSSHVAPPCDNSCATCSGNGSNSCDSCGSTRVLNGSQCPQCSVVAGKGCTSCSSNGATFVCSACAGSTLTNGGCIFSPPDIPEGPNMLLIILLPILAAALLCCCLILFCCWRRRKNQEEENKVENEDVPQEDKDGANQQPENNDPFDEKLLQNKKKYRGGKQSDTAPKIKRRRAANLMHDTQQNELSKEQIKPYAQFDKPIQKPLSKAAVAPLKIQEKNPTQDIPDEFEELELEKASQKHVVNDGPQDTAPPQPEQLRQEIAPSEDASSIAEQNYSQISR